MEDFQLDQTIQASKTPMVSRRVKSRLVWGALMCGAATLCLPKAHAQTAANSVFFYPSKNKKQVLKPAESWVGVQVAPGTSLQSAANSIGAGQSVSSTLAITKQNLVLFKVGSANAAQTRANIRSRALKSQSVLRTVRTFENGAKPIIETKEFLVRFTSGVTQARAAEIVASVDGVIVRPLGKYAPNGYLVRLKDAAGTASIAAANALNTRDDVQYSMPNLVYPMQLRSVGTKAGVAARGVSSTRASFDDPLLGRQWHLLNTGQNGGTPGADVKATEAWDLTLGSGVTICINDDGVETDHPDLAANIVAGYDVVSEDNDPNPNDQLDDEPFHGTACAGVAAAVGNNGVGVSGAAPRAKILPIRAITSSTTFEDEAQSFRYAADNGADIISNSWGPADGNPSVPHVAEPAALPEVVKNAIDYAVTNGRGGKGCVVLFAAGNGGENMDVDGFASYNQVIAVGASNNKDQRSLYSDFGQSLDVVAPSGILGGTDASGKADTGTLNITTTDRVGNIGYGGIAGYPDYTNDFNGTSSACPLAAGVVGLMLSANPNLTYTQVRTLLINSTDKIDTANGQYDSNGHSIYYGYGRINALKAVQAAQPSLKVVRVSGRVVDASNKSVPGVTIAARTGSSTGTIVTSAVTNSGGTYAFNVVSNATYYVTPVRGNAKIAFSPTSRTVRVVTTAIADVNFVVKNVPKITLTNPRENGSVTGTANVTATTTNNEDVNDVVFSFHAADSSYTGPAGDVPDSTDSTAGVLASPITVKSPNTTDVLGTVTGSYSFTHQERSDVVVTLIAPDQSRYTLYNRATVGSGTVSNTFSLSAAGVNANGVWNLEVRDIARTNTGRLTAWSLTVLPQRTIIGTDRAVDSNGVWSAAWDTSKVEPGLYQVEALAEANSINDTAISKNVRVTSSLGSVTGMVTLNSKPLQGVTVTATQNGQVVKSATTQADGTYSITTLANGTYTITPTYSGYSFNPPSSTAMVTGSNVPNNNFTAIVGAPTPTPSPDTTAPVVSVTTPSSNSVNANVTSVVGRASDAETYVNRVRVQLDLVSKTGTITPVLAERSATLSDATGGVQWTLATGTLAEGRYRVIATARDAAGNTAGTQSFFFVDRSVPSVTIGTPSSGSSQSGAFTATGTAADIGSYVRSVRIKLSLLNNGQPVLYYTGSSTLSQTYDPNRDPFGTLADEGEGVRWQLNVASLPSGSYQMDATATDATGRTAVTTSRFTIR